MDFLQKALADYFQPQKETLAFVEVKKGGVILFKGEPLPIDVPLPVSVKTVARAVEGQDLESFGGDELFINMLRVITLDPKTPFAKSYKKILGRLDEKERQALLLEGLHWAQQGQYSEALMLLLGYRLCYGGSKDTDYNIGRLLLDLFEKREESLFEKLALQTFEHLSLLYEDLPQVDFHLGFLYYNQQHFGRAKKAWRLALASDDLPEPMRDEILTTLPRLEQQVDFEEGRALILSGRAQEGIEKLLPLSDRHDDWWELYFFLGLAHRQMEEYEKAIAFLLKVMDLHTAHVETLNELGLCLMATGDFKGAEKVYREAVGLRPSDHELLCNLGITTLYTQDAWTAQSIFEKSLSIQEDPITRAWLLEAKKTITQ